MAERVRVRRTGGFMGLAAEGTVDLSAAAATDDEPTAEVRRLADAVDLSAAPEGQNWPDMYVYEFDVDGTTANVPEHLLTPELRRLAELVLGSSG